MAEPRILPTIGIALLVSVTLSAGGLLWIHQRLDSALALRPPLVILDLSAVARTTDPAQLPALLAAYRTTAERLAGQGLLVLERQAVLAAPTGLILTEKEVRHAAD